MHQQTGCGALLGAGGLSKQSLLAWRLTPGGGRDTELASSSDDSLQQPNAGTKVLAKMRIKVRSVLLVMTSGGATRHAMVAL